MAFALPVGALALALFNAPAPYRLIAEPDAQWRAGQVLPAGGRAMVRSLSDDAAARTAARRTLESISTSSSSSMPGVHRYRARAGDEHGLILAIGRYVLVVAAPDDAALEQAIAAVPFIAPNAERSGVAAMLDRHLWGFVAGILGYALLFILLASRTLAWAARRPPLPDVPAAGEADLRSRLLALDFPGVSASVRADGELVFERAGEGWVEQLRLQFDGNGNVVRALSGGSAQWARSLGHRFDFFKYWWRTMPRGPRSDQVAELVQSLGWVWQPVFTFRRLIGG
ncbi:hypothetical protein [Bordetella sp. BOR01]|uniref:hypothetical protein n=1 Tax=Bordetella sp. BOR01 TaxID=2854779 RepID=UPI001C4557AB|nr:hypothetical protein [Bordetella sp. BOR01]MBV7483428.1 hypothetical protein [Bordetella sp. BOR01]